MRYFKKTSAAILLLAACVLAIAGDNNLVIKNAELQSADDYYALNADIEVTFNDEIETAVNKGVPLNFLVEFQIVSPRKYWFDDEIVTTTTNVALSYHALSRQYIVGRANHQQTYETFAEAKEALADLSGWKVADKSLFEKDETYKAALLIRLDESKLPKAIQVDAIASEKWTMTSQKYEWSLKELNK